LWPDLACRHVSGGRGREGRAGRNAVAWLYDITIDEEERGRGYGRAAMTALEDQVRALGQARSRSTSGGEEVARGLDTSLGCAEESVHMRKRL